MAMAESLPMSGAPQSRSRGKAKAGVRKFATARLGVRSSLTAKGAEAETLEIRSDRMAMPIAVRDPMVRGMKIIRALRHRDNREGRNKAAASINGDSSPIRKSRSITRIADLPSGIAARGSSRVPDSPGISTRRISRSVLRDRTRPAIPDRRPIRNSDTTPDSITIHSHPGILGAGIRSKASPALRTRVADLIAGGSSPIRKSRSVTKIADLPSRITARGSNRVPDSPEISTRRISHSPIRNSHNAADRNNRAIPGLIGWRKMIAVPAGWVRVRRNTTGLKSTISTDLARCKSLRNSVE